MDRQYLTPLELSAGPDLLRPGSKTGHLGNGQVAFIYTKYSDPDGNRFFTVPASMGHECMIVQDNIVQALFGPDLDNVKAEIGSVVDEYQKQGLNYVPTGWTEVTWNHYEIRRLSRDNNLYGRYGNVRGRSVVMLWLRNQGWEDMLQQVIIALRIPEEAILTAGTEEIGTIRGFLGK